MKTYESLFQEIPTSEHIWRLWDFYLPLRPEGATVLVSNKYKVYVVYPVEFDIEIEERDDIDVEKSVFINISDADSLFLKSFAEELCRNYSIQDIYLSPPDISKIERQEKSLQYR